MADLPIPRLPGRLLKLSSLSGLEASPLEADPPATLFSAISFPPFPLSQSAWLTGLGEHFFERHKRGVAALLLLDTHGGDWARPLLPTQRCSPEGASFQLCASDFAGSPPSHRVGGSFQLTCATTMEESQAQVPAFDGLHQVYAISGRLRTKYFFVRAQGIVHHMLPESVMFDDWRQYLVLHRDRLTLA